MSNETTWDGTPITGEQQRLMLLNSQLSKKLAKEKELREKAEAKLKDVASKLKKLTADWHMDAPLEEIEKLAKPMKNTMFGQQVYPIKYLGEDIPAERKEWQKRIANEHEFNRQLFELLEGVGVSIKPDLDEIDDRIWRINKVVMVNQRAEKAEAKLEKVREWNENNKPVYPIVDMVGEVKHMRYTALRGILRDAE